MRVTLRDTGSRESEFDLTKPETQEETHGLIGVPPKGKLQWIYKTHGTIFYNPPSMAQPVARGLSKYVGSLIKGSAGRLSSS